MEEEELESKVVTFYHLNTQLKSLGKLKDSLRDEIKAELKDRKIKLLELDEYRADFSTYTRSYAKKEKIDKFLIKSGENLKDYYSETEIERLQIVKKINV